MGFHVISGSNTRTPEFCYNHGVDLSWGGKELAELSEHDVWRMRRFIEVEAYRIAYNDARNGDTAGWNPFKSGLLFGEPCKLWNHFYQQGQRDFFAGIERGSPEPPLLDELEYDLWPGIVAHLEALADGFEASYRQIGVIRRSNLRDVVQALCGWFNCSVDDFIPVYEEKRFVV